MIWIESFSFCTEALYIDFKTAVLLSKGWVKDSLILYNTCVWKEYPFFTFAFISVRSLTVSFPMWSDLKPTESGSTGPWLANNQSRDLNNEFWLVVYLFRSVPGSDPAVRSPDTVRGYYQCLTHTVSFQCITSSHSLKQLKIVSGFSIS